MKKIRLILSVFVLAAMAATSTAFGVEVTLRVDMAEQTVSPDGVHVAGSFQGWNPSSTLMINTTNDIYELIILVNQGDHLLYKFINGNDWPYVEQVPSQCGEPDGFGGYNRYFDVPANDTILTAVCFGSCFPCANPTVDITFQVDMSNEVVSPNGVHIAGSFQGWDPGATPMAHIGNNVYSVMVPLGIGEYHEFKYINGNAWGFDESVPPACANNNNRFLTVPSQNTTLPLVCFGSCDPCTTITDIEITFQVDMSNETVSPNGVHVAGSFQGWNPGGTLMNDIGNNIYAVTAILQSGAYHEYKFINGDQWGEDELVPPQCNMNGNRYLVVPDVDSTLLAVCFGSCNICNPPPVDVTFTVDMSNETVSPDGVHLAGSFQGWDPSATPMTDIGSDIYEVTLTLGANDYHEYKFINGNDWPGAENVPPECNMNGNRYIWVPEVNTGLQTVCFGNCGPCPAPSYNVDLKVNLEGPFNGTDMNTQLNSSGYIPVNQPYNQNPWNYNGTETANPIPNPDVVDWVLIELRETTGDASTATPDSIIAQKAGLLLKNGKVVETDGSSQLNFTGSIDDNLYAVIWHRNHLGIMSGFPIPGIGNVFAYDFSTGATQVYMGSIAHKEIAAGIWGMIGGDGNADGQISNTDKVEVWVPAAGNSGYEPGDFNLDGQVNNQDKVELWGPNSGAGSQVPN
ncbi:MAG: hypothetical protein JW861_11490 [Bacteroidales bacterium]|nr:hypothetical protein [Bacteroidales bacterium]